MALIRDDKSFQEIFMVLNSKRVLTKIFCAPSVFLVQQCIMMMPVLSGKLFNKIGLQNV